MGVHPIYLNVTKNILKEEVATNLIYFHHFVVMEEVILLLRAETEQFNNYAFWEFVFMEFLKKR